MIPYYGGHPCKQFIRGKHIRWVYKFWVRATRLGCLMLMLFGFNHTRDNKAAIKDVTQAFVRTGEEAYDVMVAGKHNLQVAATGVHAQSSRSHCIFTITMLTETEGGVRSSCVRLCDLAGCERARRTRNTGARMAESRAINSSLHVLERCLHTLRRRHRGPAPVPYRESKLTRLLGAGLSGARGESVSMVVTLNPAPEYAHETRHVLQLASVARDIQVNQTTIAESTLESSTQDTTISSSAEVMKLRSDNERLHFELVQAQARNKELLAAMEERQAAAAATMRELVEEAKDMTRQYYEAQIESLRAEMEDMVEEYESRLSKAAIPAVPALGGSGTPSKALQNKVAQLMTEIAILEEKLTAEKLARARAEEEVQHLRACIEERDEANEETAHREDVMLLSDSEHDSDEEVDDPCNESLEPTFKKDDINKSRLAAQAFDQTSIRSDKSLDNSARDNDQTMNGDDGNNSVINKSEDTVRDHDNTETTDSVYATGEEDSASTNKTDMCDSKNASDVRASIPYKSYNSEISENKDLEITDNFEKEISISIKKDSAPRGTYFVRSNEVVDDINDEISEDLNAKKSDSLTRGTYFVKDSKFDVTPTIQVVDEEEIREPLCDFPMEDIPKNKAKVSETLVSRIIKSVKTSHGSNTSLAQFEQLEMAACNVNETKVETKMNSSFGNINILKEKRTYFDETSSKELIQHKIEEVEELPVKEKKTYFDNIDVNLESAPNKKVTEISNENKLQTDDTRSPSIVKDEVLNDFTPSAIRKLLAESFSRKPEVISSVNKNKIIPKKHDSVDMFEGLDSPVPSLKPTENINVVEQARKSIEKMVLDQKSATKIKQELKIERETIHEEPFEISPVPVVETPTVKTLVEDSIPMKVKDVAEDTNASQEIVHKDNKKAESQNEAATVNNTIEEFENLCKDITSSRATEFDMLISQESNTTNTSEDKCETLAQAHEETKYNLRHKTHSKTENVKFADKVEKEEYEEVLLESHAKCESKAKPTKRSLRLRRKKNQSDERDVFEQENGRLKDIVNLQKEFSDVTLDVPAPLKEVKDIQSPEKAKCEVENVPPLMGVQSCPSKSVTRSRRKLFTPRAEPLDESAAGDSAERVCVPRPSYHRARARRKL